MRAYLIHFFIVVASLLLPATIFAWWAEPIHGDLTRIGHWTEHDFGPNAIQPTIHIKATGRSLVNPDISILGDSFGAPNLWQSALAETTGYSVKSFHHDKNCLTAWIEAAKAQASTKIIVVETVERSFVVRFSNVSRCSSTELVAMEIPRGITESHRPLWPLTLSWSYLMPAAINTAKLNLTPEKHLGNESVVNVPIIAECAGFSNRRSDRLLYLKDDDVKNHWDENEIQAAVNNVVRIQQDVERSGKAFVFVVAPDKSSVYRRCLLPADNKKAIPNINAALIAAGVNAPDMLRTFRDKIPTTTDLYRPNDTHWSEAGFILAGETVGHYATKKLGRTR